MIEDQYHNKPWGVEDFKRYYSQQMSNAERHALEKAALDDPFLEDALEGYAIANTPAEDVVALKQKLQLKKESKKVVVFSVRRRNQLLKVAAILLLFSGLTWLLYPGTKKPSTELATISGSAPVTAEQPDSATDIPSPATQNQLETKNETLPPAGALQPVLPAIDKIPNNTKSKDAELSNNKVAAMAQQQKANASSTEKSAAPLSRATTNNTVGDNLIKGIVVDNQGAPVPYATVTVPQNNSNVAADVNGVFFLRNNQQSNVVANVKAPGFETTNAPLIAGTEDNKIVLQESKESLSEVVVAGYGKRKNSVDGYRSPLEPVEPNRISLYNVRAFGSAKNFADSLRQLSASLIVSDTSGYVLLHFDVADNGEATNIIIKKSLCSNCDAEAIHLLQKILALKRTNKNKPEARISF